MKSLNTSPRIIEYTRLCVKFKLHLRQKDKEEDKIFLYLFDSNLHGLDLWFHLWIWTEEGIQDLDIHLKNLELNRGRKYLYLSRSKGRHVIVNR